MSAVKNVIKDNYNMMLLNNYLKVKIKESGFSKVEVAKTPTGTRVVLYVTRPGIVIGRGGTEVETLKTELKKFMGYDVNINVSETNKFFRIDSSILFCIFFYDNITVSIFKFFFTTFI